jgi:hypothetical protein
MIRLFSSGLAIIIVCFAAFAVMISIALIIKIWKKDWPEYMLGKAEKRKIFKSGKPVL